MGATILVQKIFNPSETQIPAGPFFSVDRLTVDPVRKHEIPLDVFGFWIYQRAFVMGTTRAAALITRSGISQRTYQRLMSRLRSHRMAITSRYRLVTQTAVLAWPLGMDSYTSASDLFAKRLRREVERNISNNSKPGWTTETAREFFEMYPTIRFDPQQYSAQVVIHFVEHGPGPVSQRLDALGLWVLMSFAPPTHDWKGARQTARELGIGKSRTIELLKLLGNHQLIISKNGTIRVKNGIQEILNEVRKIGA